MCSLRRGECRRARLGENRAFTFSNQDLTIDDHGLVKARVLMQIPKRTAISHST
jgi:hypothetical protein